MKLLRAVTVISGFTGISRITGLVREILISHILGAGMVTDAFFVAFKFPNFFRRLFAEGALNAAFVPTFSGDHAHQGLESAKRTSQEVFSVLVTALLIFVAVVLVFTPTLMPVIAPGFRVTPERLNLAVDFMRLTFPYILFISLAALLTGILNSLDRFAAGAAAPILLNITMIAALLGYTLFSLEPGYVLSFSVLVAGVIQFLWLYIACWRAGLPLKWQRPRLTPKVKTVLRLMLPGALGAGLMQINLFIDLWLATLLPEGSLSYLYYAERLNQLPLSLFGVAIGTALLPKLSRLLQKGEDKQAQKIQETAIELGLQLSIPSSVGLMVLAYPIISLIYGHGKFDETAILATAPTLAALASALPAYVSGKVLTATFFAQKDTVTPMKIGMFCLGLNVVLNLILMWPLLQVGMALATSLTAWCQVLLLLFILKKRGAIVISPVLKSSFLKVSFVSFVMGAALWILNKHFVLPKTLFAGIGHLSFMMGSGIVVFFLLGYWLGAFDIRRLRESMRKT